MNNSKHYTLTNKLQDLKKRNFTSSFQLHNNKMICPETGKRYTPDRMHVVDFFRFEGAGNLNDRSILYAIECEDGNKGTIISTYGNHGDMRLVRFLKKVEMKKDTYIF